MLIHFLLFHFRVLLLCPSLPPVSFSFFHSSITFPSFLLSIPPILISLSLYSFLSPSPTSPLSLPSSLLITEYLNQNADMFQRQAVRLKRKLWWQNVKVCIPTAFFSQLFNLAFPSPWSHSLTLSLSLSQLWIILISIIVGIVLAIISKCHYQCYLTHCTMLITVCVANVSSLVLCVDNIQIYVFISFAHSAHRHAHNHMCIHTWHTHTYIAL